MTAPCRFLEWDTDFFGVRVARVNETRLYADSALAIDAWCDSNRVDCLYFLAECDDKQTALLAQVHGYLLVDIRVTLEVQTLNPHALSPNVRPATLDDLPALRDIAQTSYHDTRYYYDPYFPREKASALYVTWITKSIQENYADVVFVRELEGVAVGFISCHLRENGQGEIGLVGVAETARGQKVGQSLVRQALDWFSRHDCQKVSVVTQGRNINAQRLYQSHGFRTQALQLWYHKWFLRTKDG